MTENREPVKYIDPAEFRSVGYLQELNRRFLHPLGLALEVRPPKRHWWQRLRRRNRQWTIGGVWDFRDDPEGMNFGGDHTQRLLRASKAALIDRLWADREPLRQAALGYMVQPITE